MSPSERVSRPAPGPSWHELPGLRVFRSASFRCLLAAVLLVLGGTVLGVQLVRQASLAPAAGQYGIDFADWYAAAGRVAAGSSPYLPETLLGPVPTQVVGVFKYPPPLAQLLVPLTILPLHVAATLWLAVQLVMALVGTWIAGGIGALAPSRERMLWTAAAAVYFLPLFDTLWKGNIGGALVLGLALAALGSATAGVSISLLAIGKILPGAFLPCVVADGRRAALSALATLAAVVLVSAALAPVAWSDFSRIVPNLLAGSADFRNNLAPDVLVGRYLLRSEGAVAAIRIIALTVGLASLVGSVLVARRRGRSAAVVLAAVTFLLLPSAVWYHYLVVLLPVAALAWGIATPGLRVALAAGGGLVSAGVAWLPLALVGAALVLGSSLRATLRRAAPSPARARLDVPAPLAA